MWVKDAKRAILVWGNIVKVLNHWGGLCKSKRLNVSSYETLVSCYLDSLINVKFQYFAFTDSILAECLITFQIDSPLVSLKRL